MGKGGLKNNAVNEVWQVWTQSLGVFLGTRTSACPKFEINLSFMLVSVTSSGAVWVALHQFGIMKMNYEKKNNCCIPMSIYVFGLVLLGVSSFQYFHNTALRKFTKKTFQNKIIPIMSFRDANILRFSRERFIMKMRFVKPVSSSQHVSKCKQTEFNRCYSYVL